MLHVIIFSDLVVWRFGYSTTSHMLQFANNVLELTCLPRPIVQMSELLTL